MRKSRASLEPFWDLKISKYVEYLMCVSSKYIKSWVPLSLRSTAGWTSCVFLAYVMPWINTASLVLYMAYIIVKGLTCETCSAMPRPTWGLEGVLCCQVRLCGWSIETCHYPGWESVLDSISMISGAGIDVYTFYWQPFITCTITLCSYWGYGHVFISYKFKIEVIKLIIHKCFNIVFLL